MCVTGAGAVATGDTGGGDVFLDAPHWKEIQRFFGGAAAGGKAFGDRLRYSAVASSLMLTAVINGIMGFVPSE